MWINALLPLAVLLLVSAQSYGNECYVCSSALPSNVTEPERSVIKGLITNTFQLPPIMAACSDPKDPEFHTVRKEACMSNNCTKIVISHNGIELVIRGCRENITKPGVQLNEQQCNVSTTCSISYCQTNLCNAAAAAAFVLQSRPFGEQVVLSTVLLFSLAVHVGLPGLS